MRRASAVAPYGYLVKPVQQRELNATVQMAQARVRASRERLQAERRLRLALDNARMGVVTLTEGADLVEIDGHFPPIADKALRGLRMGWSSSCNTSLLIPRTKCTSCWKTVKTCTC